MLNQFHEKSLPSKTLNTLISIPGETKTDNLNDGEHHQINHHWLEDFYGKENAKILEKFLRLHILPGHAGGKWYNNSMISRVITFDVAYYVHISIGKWNKQYEIVEIMGWLLNWIIGYFLTSE